MSRHLKDTSRRFPNPYFAGNDDVLECINDPQPRKDLVQAAIEIRDDPEAYPQAPELRQDDRNVRKKFPDPRTSKRMVNRRKIVIEWDYPIARLLHCPDNQLPPPLPVVIGTGTRRFQGWSKGLPRASKCPL